jgi:hypothetical protein
LNKTVEKWNPESFWGGRMEEWNDGMMEEWNDGMME